MDYLDKYWINYQGIKSFNIYEYIKSEKANNSIKYLFITNNIAESFHGQIEKYLPKGKTTKNGFILCMTKILNDLKEKKLEIKRHDYKTRVLINLADAINKSGEFRWITNNEFKEILNNIIKKNEKFNENNVVNNLIDDINDEIFNDNIEEVVNEEIKDGENNNNLCENSSDINDDIADEIDFTEEDNKRMDNNINNDEAKIDAIENVILKEDLLKTFEDISSIENIEQKNENDNEKKEPVNEKKKKFNYPKVKKRTYNECIKNSKINPCLKINRFPMKKEF